VLAGAQCDAVLAYGSDQTWDATAAQLVETYRKLLARPPLVTSTRSTTSASAASGR
jgi:hypothetical protein